MSQSHAFDDHDGHRMSLGDLDTVKEEQSQKSEHDLDSSADQTTDNPQQNISLQDAFNSFRSKASNNNSPANRQQSNKKKKTPKKTHEQMQIEKRLAKLKLREKAKRYAQIARTQI